MKKLIIVLSFPVIFSNAYSNNSDSLFSQKDTTVSDTTTECTIETVSKVTHEDVHLFGLRDSTVNISKDNLSKEIFIKESTEEYKNGFVFLNGLLTGAAFAVPLSLIGGVIGVVVPKNHIYNLRKFDLEEKKITLNYIVKKYSNR